MTEICKLKADIWLLHFKWASFLGKVTDLLSSYIAVDVGLG